MEAKYGTKGATSARDLKGELEAMGVRYPQALGAALYEEASIVFAESQIECPVDTGRLRNSGGVSPPPNVTIFYGTDYALAVHERDVPHRTGKSKYLEDPFRRSLPGLLDRLAIRTMQHAIDGTGVTLLPSRPPMPPKAKKKSKKAKVKK